MKTNDRIRGYAKQIGLQAAGSFKNSTTKSRLISRLTPAQQRRVKKKELAVA